MNETISVILNRRSIRAYKEEQLKQEELDQILEAGKYAPSSVNQQPWHFTVVQNKDIMNKINEGAREIIKKSPNKEFAKRAEAEDFSVYYNAPTLLIISGDKDAISPQIDSSLALHNMFLAAESLNIGSCWINAVVQFLETEDGKALYKDLAIPENYKVYSSGVFGYKAVEPETPPKKENVVNFVK